MRQRSIIVAVAALVGGSVATPLSVSADTSALPDTAAAARVAIETSLDALGATSITAGLTDVDGVLWQGTTGIIDAGGVSPGASTRYGIGSTSKMFAATAVMQLVDAGRIDLDVPVVNYLPTFTMLSPDYRQITVRMLLDHSAGFPGSTYSNGFTTEPYADYAADVLANLASSRLKTTPGAMSVYCNDCFTVAGEVVAAVSGVPFTEYVERNILAPLGMDESLYVTGALPVGGTVARVVDEGRTLPLEVTNVYASGGLMSTPDDMLSFARMLLAGGTSGTTRVLSASAIGEMATRSVRSKLDIVDDANWNYGLGWDTVSNHTLRAVDVEAWVKGGDTRDYHASLVIAPDAGLAAFVAGAGHYSSGAAMAVAEEIILHALVERGELPEMPTRLGVEQPPKVTPSDADFRAVVGTYLGSAGIGFRLSRGAGDTLVSEELHDGAWVPVPVTASLRTDGHWWADRPSAVRFGTVEGWGRTYLTMTEPGGYGNAIGVEVLGERITPTGKMAREWRGRLGDWLSVSDVPSSTQWLGSPITTLSRIPGLPGYLEVSGFSPIAVHDADAGRMFLQVPLMWGRDLDDVIPMSDDEMRVGSYVMVKRDTVASVSNERSRVVIGPDGHAEWREVGLDGRVVIRGADAWYLYDSNGDLLRRGHSDHARVRADAQDLFVVFGAVGDTIDVRVRMTEG